IFDGDNTPENGATVYLFGNTIYTGIAAIQEDIKKAPISNLATAYSKAFTVNESDNSVVPISDEAVEAAGFTAYKPATDGKYYCYYFYFNRHNDDENPTTTGVMEFATVRNNVYKLSVTGVKKLGGFKPDEKVEDWDAYFSLNVAVKPWVVRVNNIEF
ncbi:MAG: fimbria major subunit, partial [Muribaculaceae bacterium]|nr:fimbria major subunit [Muribaculaceae bacterium]